MTPRSEDRDLRDYLTVLWSRRWILLGTTALAAAVALAGSMMLAKKYRSTAMLMIAGSKVPTINVGEAGKVDSRLYGDTYAELIRSPSIASRVIRELDLAKPPHTLDEEELTKMLTVRAVPGTVLLSVSLDYHDAEIAARIVNAQTSQAVALSKSLATADLTDTRAYLQEQLTAGRRELDARLEALRELKGRLRHDETAKQLEGLLALRRELEQALATAQQRAAESGAQVDAIANALQNQQKIIVLNKSLGTDATLRDAAQAASGKGVGELLGLEMRSQEINPLFAQSEPELVKARANAAGFGAQREMLRRQLEDTRTTIQRLERELADKSAALNAAQREHDLAKTTYESFAKSYEGARLSVAAQAAELKIVDPAAPGLKPVSPKVMLNVLVATATAWILGVFLILFLDYLRTARRVPVYPVESRLPPEASVGLRSSR